MRANLLAQGVSDAAISSMVEFRWADSTSVNYNSGWRQWARFCASEKWDDTIRDNPSAVHVVNFLAAVRAGGLSVSGRLMSANWVRKVRSTVSIMVSMWSQTNVRIGCHPLVTAYIDSITNEDYRALDRRVYRYDDTWDTQLVFDYIHDHPANLLPTGSKSERIKFISALRDHCIALARLLLACRSSDLACVYRGASTAVTCLRWERNAASVLTGVSIRFYRPKERNSMPVSSKGYSRWVTIPVVPDPLICFATLLYGYVSYTAVLPCEDDGLFISAKTDKRHNNRLYSLSSQRLAKSMKGVMTASGVPDDFMSHSARHAGIALRKEGASVLIATGYQTKPWCDAEVMSLARMSARTYVTHYLRNIRAAALDDDGPSA